MSIVLGGRAYRPEDAAALKELGLPFAEISLTGSEAFAALINDYRSIGVGGGFHYLCHGPSEGDPNDLRALREIYLPKILDLLPLMGRLDSKVLTLHLWMDGRFVKGTTVQFKIALLERITERARSFGITVCLENLSEEASHFAEAFERLPHLMMTLDVGHGQLLSKGNRSYGFMKRFPDRIRHIHLHDNRGGSSPKDDLHLPPGEGTIDFDRFFHALKRMGYHGTMTLELRPQEIEKSLTRVKKWLEDTR